MTDAQVENDYLVVGRNRREKGGSVVNGRPVIGKKGIGKLAGFGIASRITVTTWRDRATTTFTLEVDKLKVADSRSEQYLYQAP